MSEKIQIAVYGIGPASIFFLEEFINTDIQIHVFEHGKVFDRSLFETIDKINGPIKFFNNSYKERAKGFFGTASLWSTKGVGGKLFKFDEEDLINNNWPVSYKDLNIYYQKVIENFDKNFDMRINKELNNNNLKHLINTKLENFKIKKGSQSLSYCFNKVINYYKKKIINAKNIKIYYQHTLANFEIDKNNNQIKFANILNKKELKKITANFHILSTGCLETNRVMLETFKNNPSYIDSKKIGRGLTFHPGLNLGTFDKEKKIKKKKIKTYIDYKNEIVGIKIFEQNKKSNSAAFLSFIEKSEKKILPKLYNKFFGNIDRINASLAIEHLPSNDCSVTLSDRVDENGKSKINIFSNFNEENMKFAEQEYFKYLNFFKNIKMFGYTFIKDDFCLNLETNNHHHGGILFGRESNRAVDQNLQFKDLKNLFINGSAVFPTSSVYNPTLTIVALAKRLGLFIYDRLQK
jgi:hypothetical protein